MNYNFKKEHIIDLKLIKDNNDCIYVYNDINFLAKLKDRSNNLIFILHGSVPIKDLNRITFRGYDFILPNTDIISVSDSFIYFNNSCHISWYLSTKKYNFHDRYIEVFKYLINRKKYKNIIFTGTSAGGYPSIYFAAYFNKIALVSNSQLYLENYGNNYNNLIKLINKNEDELLYEHKNIETFLKKMKPHKIILYNNTLDSTYNRDTRPFIKYLEDNKLEKLLELNLFEGELLNSIQCHHNINFPNQKKHQEILVELLDKLNQNLL
jgi:hypothetical protein